MRTEGELVDVVREVEGLVVEMVVRAPFHVSVPAGGDVEVALDFVALERAVDPTAILDRRARDARRVGEFAGWVGAHVPQDVRDMRVLLFLLLALGVAFVVQALVGAFPGVGPDAVVGGFFGEQVAGHNAVHGGVLDVDVQVFALHGDDDVEVELQFMPDAAFDGEVVGFVAGPPCFQLGEGEQCTENDQGESPLATPSGR